MSSDGPRLATEFGRRKRAKWSRKCPAKERERACKIADFPVRKLTSEDQWWPVARALLWRGGLPPFDCAAVV